MWIFYENPQIKKLEELEDKEKFPKLRKKAKFGCIPTTAGTASEVSRSIVITDDNTGYKHGIGNMEMMPDLAICDPITTLSLPKKITAQTGIDALTHAIEAYVSNRANYLSDILAKAAIIDIFKYLPKAYNHGDDIKVREIMLNAAMVAGLSFTNVSLGIVHSISHSLGSVFKIPHGTANSILLPYVVKFNSQDEVARKRYDEIASWINEKSLPDALRKISSAIEIPKSIKDFITKEQLLEKIDEIVDLSVNDGCTKTNPIIPTKEQFRQIIIDAYNGDL